MNEVQSRSASRDVHEDPIDLAPQWFPQSWELTAAAAAKSLALNDSAAVATAAPARQAPDSISKSSTPGLAAKPTSSAATCAARPCSSSASPMPGSWRHTATQEGAHPARAAERRRRDHLSPFSCRAVVGMTGDAGAGNIRTQLYPDRHERADVLARHEGRRWIFRDDDRRSAGRSAGAH